MDGYKSDFIDFLLATNSLRVGGDFTLKSKRSSPYFINIGDFNHGEATAVLGEAYAQTIKKSGVDFDLVYGIPEKGIAIAIATSIGLAKNGINKPWFFNRKVAKDYGEATNLTKEEKRKALVVGRMPKDEDRIIIEDDVLTTAESKYEAKKLLDGLWSNLKYPALAIAVDRQEVGIDGRNAVEEFTKETGIPVISILSTSEIYQYLKTRTDLNQADVERIANYLRVYGTEKARNEVGKLPEKRIIKRERSIIPACDVSTIEEFEEIIKQTSEVDGIGGYKVGLELSLGYGLPRIVETAKKHTKKPIIYDHQKAATDIPDLGKNFARVCKKAGVDAIIIFPQSGPETERAWIYHALDNELNLIVGGRMTHPAYVQSEGGFISDEGAMEIYRIAARVGVNNFVVPGNKIDVIKTIRESIEAEGIDPVFYAPGFVEQGGKIGEAAKVAGEKWNAIVGRGIFKADDMRKAAIEHASQLDA